MAKSLKNFSKKMKLEYKTNKKLKLKGNDKHVQSKNNKRDGANCSTL